MGSSDGIVRAKLWTNVRLLQIFTKISFVSDYIIICSPSVLLAKKNWVKLILNVQNKLSINVISKRPWKIGSFEKLNVYSFLILLLFIYRTEVDDRSKITCSCEFVNIWYKNYNKEAWHQQKIRNFKARDQLRPAQYSSCGGFSHCLCCCGGRCCCGGHCSCFCWRCQPALLWRLPVDEPEPLRGRLLDCADATAVGRRSLPGPQEGVWCSALQLWSG